jgi:RNA polymerase sporulation-specific sigma factor
MGLVYMQLHRSKLAYDDEAFSYAMEGLMKAAQTFDESKGFTFSTYAAVCIYNNVAQYLRIVNKKRKLDVISYDSTLDDETGASFKDFLPDYNTPEEMLLKKEMYDVLMQKFDEVVDSLRSEHSVRIIEIWRESEFTAKQTEIAEQVGVTQAQVSRVLSTFKYKLKKEMEDYLC